MKKVVKIILILIGIFVILGAGCYIDYYIAKTKNTNPKIALKKELNSDLIVYNGMFYRMWYCKVNKTYTVGSYSDKDAICNKNYEYKDGYYTNNAGIKISKRDLQLLTNTGIYTSEMVENINSDTQLENAIHVAYDYEINKYKVVVKDNKELEVDDYKIVVFPEFKEVEDNYDWMYDESDTTNYYCISKNKGTISKAKYDGNECLEFEQIKMDKNWCENYKNSTLSYEDNIEKLCEE